MTTKPKKKQPIPVSFDLAYGKDSAAQPGTVMVRIGCEGRILADVSLPPEEFLNLAHAFEVVARAVSDGFPKKDDASASSAGP